MNKVLMLRANIKPEKVAEAEVEVQKVFAAISQAQPEGVRYASSKTDDGNFVVLLQLEGEENPLALLPEFKTFQENLKEFLAGPPIQETLEVVGSYRLFE